LAETGVPFDSFERGVADGDSGTWRNAASRSAMADDIVHLRVDTAGLKPGHYSASITVSSWQVLKPVNIEVELTVN